MKLKKVTGLFAKSLKLAKSNPLKSGQMILFDIAFLVSFLYVLPVLAQNIAAFIVPYQISPGAPQYLWIYTTFSAVYYLIILFLYSFFKYCVLDFVKSLFQKSQFSLRRLGKFYLLNVIIILPIYLLFSAIMGNVKPEYHVMAFFAVGIPFSFLLYILVNASHSAFYQGSSTKGSLTSGFGAFANPRVYMEILSVLILAVIVMWALLWIIGYIIRLATLKDYSLYLSVYSYFNQASIIAFDIVVYFALFVSRISFYSLIKGKE